MCAKNTVRYGWDKYLRYKSSIALLPMVWCALDWKKLSLSKRVEAWKPIASVGT